MNDGVDRVPFETTTAAGVEATAAGLADLERLHGVPVELAVEIGRTRMTIGEALALGRGSIVTLNRLAGEPGDLVVNGEPIARGEVRRRPRTHPPTAGRPRAPVTPRRAAAPSR